MDNLLILQPSLGRGCSAPPAISGHQIGHPTSGKALPLFWPGSIGLKVQSTELKQLHSAVRTWRNPHALILEPEGEAVPLVAQVPLK